MLHVRQKAYSDKEVVAARSSSATHCEDDACDQRSHQLINDGATQQGSCPIILQDYSIICLSKFGSAYKTVNAAILAGAQSPSVHHALE